MPFPALRAIIVLPDFARSFSADEEEALNEPGSKASKGLTEKRAMRKGVNDGLAFRDVPEKRKEPAESVEAFFCLDLWLLWIKPK